MSALLFLFFGCGDPCASDYVTGDVDVIDSGPVTFTRRALEGGICGPAFADVGDLDGDGAPELVVSWFGKQTGASVPNGGLTAWSFTGGLDAPERSEILSADDGVKWPNEPHLDDIDGDGDLDLTVGLGFLTCLIDPWTAPCGGLIGFENDGGALERFDVIPPGDLLFYHSGALADLDGDGARDLITVGESVATPFGHQDRAEVQWLRGDGAGRFEPTPRVIGEGLGSLPTPYDVDGDGDLDLVGAEFFRADAASFAWFEQSTPPSDILPAGAWTRHVIDGDSGPSIQLTPVPDLYGDGRVVFVGTNHVNNAEGSEEPGDPAVLAYTIPDDPAQPWDRAVLADDFVVLEPGAGVGAPGIFGHGDIDGDGDLDLVVSGDGDRSVYWLEQTAPGDFSQHVLAPDLPQAGAMQIVDLDGDGVSEVVVSGYDDNVVFLYTPDVDAGDPADTGAASVEPSEEARR